ncbi:MAG: glycosyltransferase [Thiobacillus sp.]|nr:glycosyltransferase [Thiobacillus sp.]
MAPRLSVVVVSYNMAREIPRTIRSLSPTMQRGIAAEDYEIILVDNGSSEPYDKDNLRQWGGNLRFAEVANPTASPVAAVNLGLELAQGELCGVLVDGARMVTPGLLAAALAGGALAKRPVIATVGFHLGPEHQSRSVLRGYNQAVEDRLLDEADWTSDPYRLFRIAVFAGSSTHGWFAPMTESNALFLPKWFWQELGGFDPQFTSPGGGLANLDVYARACAASDSQLIVLLGEGTFHQIHSGISSNSAESKWPEFHAEYQRIRGHAYATPRPEPFYLGKLNKHAMPFMAWSAQHLLKSG